MAIASTVVFARVLVEVAVVAPSLLASIAAPLGAMMLFMAATSAVAVLEGRSALASPDETAPPSDLKAAVVFGALYAAVLFGVAIVKNRFGDAGMYVVAAMSGLTDMDAITLSSAQLMKTQTIDTSTGWRLILVGAMSNMAFKTDAVAILGTRRLAALVAIVLLLTVAGGTALFLFWP